jgi:hypothetical protein
MRPFSQAPSGASPSDAEEKLVGSGVDVRTILNFQVAPGLLHHMLPPGWEFDLPASGPSGDANLRVTFVDQLQASVPGADAQEPIRYVLFSIPMRKAGPATKATLLFTGLSTGGKGPYEVNAKATALVERKSVSSISGTRTESASWKFRSGDGISASLDIEYLPGAVQREQAEAETYSAAKPDFHRIYRYDQCVDVITGPQRSARLKEIDFRASGGVLSTLFDGNEQLISVTSVLWFARQVFLPVTSET